MAPLSSSPLPPRLPLRRNSTRPRFPVDGLKQGRIRDVNVRLNELEHPFPGYVQVLLVGPRGQTAILMAGGSNGFDVNGVTLTHDDEAATLLPVDQQLRSGSFRPANPGNEEIEFNEPAPITSANAALAVFDGGNPNGTWRLFVQDSFGAAETGVLAGGWELEITTKVKAKKKR